MTNKITLDEFVENNKLINIKAFAKHIGMNDVTFRALREGKLHANAETKEKFIEQIEIELHKFADELKCIKFIVE